MIAVLVGSNGRASSRPCRSFPRAERRHRRAFAYRAQLLHGPSVSIFGTSRADRAGMLATPDQEYFALARRPESSSTSLSGFRIDAMYEPAAEVGGDFYVAASCGSARMRVVFGDACGKGVSASRLVEKLRSQLRALCRSSDEPGECLTRLNDEAGERLTSDVFVTAVYLELDASTRTMRVANAGHVPVLVRKRDGSTHVLGAASGPPLGVLESARYTSTSVFLSPADIVILVTDGVVEAFGEDVEEMRALRMLIAGACHPTPQSLLRLVAERLRASRDTAVDDATLIAITTPA